MPLGLLPDSVSMLDVLGLPHGIVDTNDDDQSPREQRQNLVRDQGASTMRFMFDEWVV